MFGWEFPPIISGGLGTACYGLTKGLTQDEDLHVTFVIPTSKNSEKLHNTEIVGADTVSILDVSNRKDTVNNTPFKVIKIRSNLAPYITPEDFHKIKAHNSSESFKAIQTDENGYVNFTGDYGPNLFEEVNYYSAVAEVIAMENEFDVIHAHDWLTFQAGTAAKEISGKPLIVHIHSTEIDRNGRNINKDIFDLEKLGMDTADKIITVSKRTEQIVSEQYKQPTDKITTIYNAIDAAEKIPEKQTEKKYPEKTVTFLGRITAQKGPEFFVEAAELVLNKMDNVRFVMAGSGDLWHKMIDLVARKKMSHKFHFTGFLEGSEVHHLLSLSDVYVMPSTSEPFGISTLEAIQADVPVIISKQAGVSEVISNLLQVDYWNIEELANTIHSVLSFPTLSKSMRENAKKEIEKLTWNFAAKEVKQVYAIVTNALQAQKTPHTNA